MPLHYSNGRLALLNNTNNSWYYISVSIGVDAKPHLNVEQVGVDFSLFDFDPYAIIRADNGVLYKLGLVTNNIGVVTFTFNIADIPVAKLPFTIFIKDLATGIFYNLTGTTSLFDGLVYPALTPYSLAGNLIYNLPWRVIIPATTTGNRCAAPSNFFTQSTVIISPSIAIPVSIELLGEGGEAILNEAGKHIIGEKGNDSGILGEGGEHLLGEDGSSLQGG